MLRRTLIQFSALAFAFAAPAWAQSGQGTASGGVSSQDCSSMHTTLQQGDNAQTVGNGSAKSGGGFADGYTDNDQLRSATSGTGQYVENGVPLLGVSGGGGNGSYDFTLSINFGARAISGAFNNTNVFSGLNAVLSAGLPVSQGYASNTGPVFVTNTIPCIIGGSCTGSVALFNSGGKLASEASHSLSVTNGGAPSVGGSVAQKQ